MWDVTLLRRERRRGFKATGCGLASEHTPRRRSWTHHRLVSWGEKASCEEYYHRCAGLGVRRHSGSTHSCSLLHTQQHRICVCVCVELVLCSKMQDWEARGRKRVCRIRSVRQLLLLLDSVEVFSSLLLSNMVFRRIVDSRLFVCDSAWGVCTVSAQSGCDSYCV